MSGGGPPGLWATCSLLLASTLACTAASVPVASEVDDQPIDDYCAARCDYYSSCEGVHRADCRLVCLDRQNPARIYLRPEALQGLTACFADLGCGEADDLCLDFRFELPPDPELAASCQVCGVEPSDCQRALALKDQRRSEARSCLAETCEPACLNAPDWR